MRKTVVAAVTVNVKPWDVVNASKSMRQSGDVTNEIVKDQTAGDDLLESSHVR